MKCMLLVGNTRNKMSSVRAPNAVVIPVSTVNVINLWSVELVASNAVLELARKSLQRMSFSGRILQNRGAYNGNHRHSDHDVNERTSA